MHQPMLTDKHWLKLKSIFHNFGIYLKHNLRSFIETIIYRIRAGCPWRDIPESFGKSNMIFKRLTRWSKDNKLLKIFKLLSKNADLEWVFIDASHIPAHQHAKGLKEQAISRSIGGNSTKIHLAVDSNGNPIQFLIHDGTTHDMKVAPELVDKT